MTDLVQRLRNHGDIIANEAADCCGEGGGMSKGYVLSLCDRTGQMVLPWMEAGYRAIRGSWRYSERDADGLRKGCVLRQYGKIK